MLRQSEKLAVIAAVFSCNCGWFVLISWSLWDEQGPQSRAEEKCGRSQELMFCRVVPGTALGGKRTWLSVREVPEPRRCRAGAAPAERSVAELLGVHGSSVLASGHVRMESSSQDRVISLCPSSPINCLGSLHTPGTHGTGAGLRKLQSLPRLPQTFHQKLTVMKAGRAGTGRMERMEREPFNEGLFLVKIVSVNKWVFSINR